MAKKRRSKAGRPRKDGDRYPSGRLKLERDKGTPEAQLRRAQLAMREDGKMGDPSKTSTPLDALLTNGTITQEQWSAGADFAWMYKAVYGRADGSRPYGSDLSDADMVEIEAGLKDRIDALKADCRRRLDVVGNICAYARWPRWVVVSHRRIGDGRDIELLRSGLTAIAKLPPVTIDRREAA